MRRTLPYETYRQSRIAMDTAITTELVHEPGDTTAHAAVDQALGWFAEVERRCSRFDPASELSQLCATSDTAIEVSPLLYTAIQFACLVAESTEGAFDPTIGAALARAGFARNYVTGEERVPSSDIGAASWRDLVLDDDAHTVRLLRPLLLDLGAVAKGMAIDLAAESLRAYPGFAIDAGGDLYLGGASADGPWLVGIAHPRKPGELATRVELRDLAVCTSGDYERRSTSATHILDARAGTSAVGLASVSVIAPGAMVADALGTAAFALGADVGWQFLEDQSGIEALLILETGEARPTSGWHEYVR